MKKFEEIQSKIETEKRMTVPPPPVPGAQAPPHSSSSTDLAPSGGDTGPIHGYPNSSLTRQSSSSSSARHYQHPQHPQQQQLTGPHAHGGLQRTYQVPPPPLPLQQPQFTKILTHDVGASGGHPPPQHRAPYYPQQSFRPPYHQNNNRQPSTPPSSSSPNVPVPLNAVQCNPHQQAPPPLPPPQFDTSQQQQQWGTSNEVEKKASATDAPTPDNLPQPADESGGVHRGSTGKYRGGPSNRPYQNQQHQQQPQHQHHRQHNQYGQAGRAYPQAAGDGRHLDPPYASRRKDDSEELNKEPESVDSEATGRGEGKEKREKVAAGSRINRTTSDDRAHRSGQSSDHPPYLAKGYKKGSLGARSSIPTGQSGGGSNTLRREERRKGSDDASAGDEKKEGEKPADSGRPALSKENSNEQSRSNRPHIRPKEINQVRNFIQHDSQATRDRGVGGQKPREVERASDKGDIRSRRLGGGGGDGANRLPYNRGGGGGSRNYPRNVNNNNRYSSTDNKEAQKGHSTDEGSKGEGATIGGKGEREGPPKKSSVSKSRADEIPSDGAPAPQALKTVRSDSTPSFSVAAEESGVNKARASTGRANSAEKALETKQQKGKDEGAAEESENGGEKKTAGGKTNAKAKKKGPKRGKEDTSGSPVITSNKFTALSSMD